MENLFVLTAFLVSFPGIWGFCPENCNCGTSIDLSLNIDCSQAGFQSIPAFTPNWTSTLILKGNHIVYLNYDTVPHDLHSLDLSSNGLRELEVFDAAKLESLDVSTNSLLSLEFLANLHELRVLNAAHNNIKSLDSNTFVKLHYLEELNLNNNPISVIPGDIFVNNKNLMVLSLSNLELFILPEGLLHPLEQLRDFTVSNNRYLTTLPPSLFRNNIRLSKVDFSHNQLSILPRSLSKLPRLEHLDISSNPLVCDCRLSWLPAWHDKSPEIQLGNQETTRCHSEDQFPESNCSSVLFDTTHFIKAKLGTPVTLSCDFDGESFPEVTWVSPLNVVINATDTDTDYTVLPNGQLSITSVNRHSVGTYACHAYNSLTNVTVSVQVQISAAPLRGIEIASLYVGAACCAIFVLLTGIVQGIRYLVDFMGWWECCYCCGKRLSPRAKQIRHFLEDVEQYKSAQLERLRDNYQMQVIKIRENCMQQIERLRDSYQGQVKYLRGVRDSGTQHLTTLREQYADQARRVYDYSCERVARVRRNYVSQRARVRKFSVHQLIRLRETYKFQQKTLNKILENIPSLYLDNCRSATCARTDSVYFDDEPDVDIVNSILKQSINIALPDDIDEEVSGTPPDSKTPLEQTDENRSRKRGHARQASAGSLDFSAFFPPIRFPSRISWRRRYPDTTADVQISVSVDVCAPSSMDEEDVKDGLIQQDNLDTDKHVV